MSESPSSTPRINFPLVVGTIIAPTIVDDPSTPNPFEGTWSSIIDTTTLLGRSVHSGGPSLHSAPVGPHDQIEILEIGEERLKGKLRVRVNGGKSELWVDLDFLSGEKSECGNKVTWAVYNDRRENRGWVQGDRLNEVCDPDSEGVVMRRTDDIRKETLRASKVKRGEQ
jgi:hypothetical protein